MPPRKIPLNEHASITALMKEAVGKEKAEDVIRRKCREYVAYGKSLNWFGPAFDPRILASMLGIRVEEMPQPWDGDGRIFHRHGKPVIQYRPGQTPERQRFTICHEITHTCFRDYFEFVRKFDADAEEGTPAHRKFERLCNIGASELLMPREEFAADMASRRICFQDACCLGERYGASVDATVKRLLDFTDHPCAVAFLTDLHFDEFAPVPGRFRVKWFWKTKSFSSYLRPGTLVPKGTCLLNAQFQEQGFSSARKETWWLNNNPRSWYVEGLRLPPISDNPAYPCAMALLHAKRQR